MLIDVPIERTFTCRPGFETLGCSDFLCSSACSSFINHQMFAYLFQHGNTATFRRRFWQNAILLLRRPVSWSRSHTGGRSADQWSLIKTKHPAVEAACVHISYAVLSFRARKPVQVWDRNYNKFTEGRNLSFCNVFQSVQMCWHVIAGNLHVELIISWKLLTI